MVAGFIPGRTATLALSIYHLVQLSRDNEAWGLLVISITLAFGALWFSETLLRQKSL